ncbi:MAG: flagellar protein FlgN [Planctomycetes bacterium]|nr:flagellar protein FlgN [Planctomycetota bacterium]
MDKTAEIALAKVEETLHAQLERHAALLVLLERKRRSLSLANYRDVTECCRLENEHIQALGELEKRRMEQSAALTLALDPSAKEPLRLRELAMRVDEPARSRLLALRGQLRERMEAVRREVSVARRATESLARHMHGVLQVIGSAVTGIGTYTRAGAMPQGVTSISTFNTTA